MSDTLCQPSQAGPEEAAGVRGGLGVCGWSHRPRLGWGLGPRSWQERKIGRKAGQHRGCRRGGGEGSRRRRPRALGRGSRMNREGQTSPPALAGGSREDKRGTGLEGWRADAPRCGAGSTSACWVRQTGAGSLQEPPWGNEAQGGACPLSGPNRAALRVGEPRAGVTARDLSSEWARVGSSEGGGATCWSYRP